jgi:hypothetical protein
MDEPTPTSVYWKDDNVKDEGAPVPRTVQFRPGRKPGIHLGRQSRYYNYYLLLVLFTFIDVKIIHIMELSLKISL